MHFHLPSLRTVLLTVNHNKQRHGRMQRFFKAHGYDNVQWIFGKPTNNHHKGAGLTAIKTLRSIKCPCLWLEDDATIIDAYKPDIEVPDDAQAIYLGGGRLGKSILTINAMRDAGRKDLLDQKKWCLPKRDNEGTMKANGRFKRSLYMDTEYPEWIRILTMFTGHAILWLDDAVCREFADIIQASGKPYDIAWANHQWRFKIYGARSPFFYQDDGHHAHTVTYCPPANGEPLDVAKTATQCKTGGCYYRGGHYIG